MRNRLTQKETIFCILYDNFKSEKKHEYIPVWAFMGEYYSKAAGKWGYVSHECSARASEMKKANPDLIERKTITGKSGAKYYGYRISPQVRLDMIKDDALIKMHRVVADYIKRHDN